MEYLLDYWVGQGITRFILSIGYKSKVIVEHFGSVYKGTQVDYAIESSPLGTGGGLLLALEKVDDPDVLLLNGDTFFSVSLKELQQFYFNSNQFEDAFYVDIKTMYTPIFLDTLPKQLQKEYGKVFMIEDIGNIEREAYMSYMSHYKSGSKVVLIVACSYNPNLILCDFIENIEVIYKDEKERNMSSSGSTTPRVNINLKKMKTIKTFFYNYLSKNIDSSTNERLFNYVRKELNFIGKPKIINTKTAEGIRKYLSKKADFNLVLKDI